MIKLCSLVKSLISKESFKRQYLLIAYYLLANNIYIWVKMQSCKIFTTVYRATTFKSYELILKYAQMEERYIIILRAQIKKFRYIKRCFVSLVIPFYQYVYINLSYTNKSML